MLLFLFAVVLFFFPFFAQSETIFPVGQTYTFYCDSSSSRAKTIVCTRAAPLLKFFLAPRLTGESTVYPAAATADDVFAIAARYNAKLLFEEESAEVISYYFYTPLFKNGVSLGGQTVNLHIAVQPSGTIAVGTPLLFGGF
jgi:hypothetical protein